MLEEHKEELGQTIDRLDGFGAMLKNPFMPPDLHVKALNNLIPEIVEDFKDHFAEDLRRGPMGRPPGPAEGNRMSDGAMCFYCRRYRCICEEETAENPTTAQTVEFWENGNPAYSMKQIEAMAHGVPWRNMQTERGSEIWDSTGMPLAAVHGPLTAALICSAVNGDKYLDGPFLSPEELSKELTAATEQLNKLWAVIQNPSVVNYLAALEPRGDS